MSVNLSVENDVALLTIDNPRNLNALSTSLMSEISKKLENLEKQAKALVITGTQKAFAAGVDINEIAALSFDEAMKSDFIDEQWEVVRNIKIPTIAAVRGYALGGGFELALMCDMIIASEKATFGFPEINLGLMPGMGGTQMLTKIVGTKVASQMIMTGEFIAAEKALQLNIINKVVSDDKVLQTALDLAQKISTKPAVSLKMIKEAILMSQNTGITAGMKIERQMFRSLFSTADKKQKVSEFLKK